MLQKNNNKKKRWSNASSEFPHHTPPVALSPLFLLGSLLLITIGAGLQGYVNKTVHSLFVALFLLIVGVIIVKISFPGSSNRAELRTFILSYSVCIFVGGLAQYYSINVFNSPLSTIDSFVFFKFISPQPPFATMANMPRINSPLAVVVWQQIYKLTWWLNLDFGVYIGVMLNAFFIGFAGSITVQTTRELFGDDHWRLNRTGTLFAFCGLFILFGAVLIRDCFTTFLNAIVLLFLVRCLVRQTWRSLGFAFLVTSVSAYAMQYLRMQAVALFGGYLLLMVVVLLFIKRKTTTNPFGSFLILCIMLAGVVYLSSTLQRSIEVQDDGMQAYTSQARESSSHDSLGMRLILNQPLPIRLILGSGALMISPIPLWANFNFRSVDYLWIKGYHGLYQVVILPLVFTGIFIIIKMYRRDKKRTYILLFLTIYLILNLLAVVSTSMEQRHLAQFFPAAIIIASLPDMRDSSTRKRVHRIGIYWFSIVVFIHLAWMVVKG